VSDLYLACQERIRVGSLSFSLAAHFFGREMREGAFFLYAWCRYCDDWMDKVDQIPNLTREERSKRKLANLETLKVKTLSACRGESQEEIPFQALQAVVKKYGIPEKLPMDLIEGMAMDARDEKYHSTEDLERYCYHVAGVVG